VSDHMRSSSTWTPRRWRRRAGSAAGHPGRHGGTDPRFVGGVRELVLERGRPPSGRGAGTPVARRAGREPRQCARPGLLSQRAATRTRPALCGVGVTRRPRELLALAEDDGPGGRPADRRERPRDSGSRPPRPRSPTS
jgi:hypothetical protein